MRPFLDEGVVRAKAKANTQDKPAEPVLGEWNRASRRAQGVRGRFWKIERPFLPRYIRRNNDAVAQSTKFRRVRKQRARIKRLIERYGLAPKPSRVH